MYDAVLTPILFSEPCIRDGCTHNKTLLIVEVGVPPASDTRN